MANGFGTSPFVLPQMFAPPGQALENTLRRDERESERQYEINFRNQRLKEADDWKKLQLIQELTNLDKYQTGEQAADAIGFQRAQDLFQKYTAAAGSMTPAELQYKISQDIGKTTLGMQTMKDELMQSDAAIKQLKSAYPSLNAEALMREHRKDILNRRVSGNDFVNPQIVEPSNFKLDDPDFLSYFVRDSKGLTDAIRNPKYAEDVAVGMGSPNSYTTVKGKLPYFRKLNFDTQKDIEKGFLKKGINPSMEVLSSKAKLGNLDIDVLDDEPFGIMDEQARLELAREARQKFNDYDKMNNEEKRIARKNVAVDFVKSIDRSAFDFGTATKPPHYSSTTNVNAGGLNVNDIYKGIDDALGVQESKGAKWLPVSALNPDAKEVVIKQARLKNPDFTEDQLQIIRGEDGTIRVWEIDGDFVNYIPRVATNITKQPSVKEKKEVVERGEPTPKQKTYKGLDAKGNPIFE